MPDGSIYVVTSYALTALVLVGYAVRLAVRGRAVRRRQEGMAAHPEIDAGVTTHPDDIREPTHV